MKIKAPIIVSLLAGAVLAGCASGPDWEEMAERQAEIERERAEARAEAAERKDEQLADQLAEMPPWVLEPPKPDVAGVYGVGVAESSNVAVALKKARLQAEYELAQQLEQEISGLEQQYTEDSTGNQANLRFQSAVERFVSAVDMGGQELVEQKVQVSDGQYNGYVLMRLSFDSMERMLETRNKMEGYDRMKAAFAELRERVEAKEQAGTVQPVAEEAGQGT